LKCRIHSLLGILILLLILPSAQQFSLGTEKGKYTYYGVIPSRLYLLRPYPKNHGAYDISKGWHIDKDWNTDKGYVAIIGVEEKTHVEVYTMPGWKLIKRLTLEPLKKSLITLPNGTIFKVLSDKPVGVLAFSKNPNPNMSSGIHPVLPFTYYPSVDGGYSGKRFVLMASQELTGEPYMIFALEPSEVTLTREDGKKKVFKLEANGFKRLALKPFMAYKIESTGNIMVYSGWVTPRTYFIPAADGGFSGRRFYTPSRTSWSYTDYGFRIMALEDAKVKIWDLEFRKLIMEVRVKDGEMATVKPKADVIMVESDKPITFEFAHSGDIMPLFSYGCGVTYIGVRRDEVIPVYMPINSTVELYIFASEDTIVKIDDMQFRVKADDFIKQTMRGVHRITADNDIIVEMIHWPLIPKEQGIQHFGVAVPPIESVSATSYVKLSPIVQGHGSMLAYLEVGVIMLASIAAGFLYMKRKVKQTLHAHESILRRKC